MKQEKILEGNKFIAEFMGWTIGYATNELTNPKSIPVLINPKKSVQLRIESELYMLYFHSSWDWLMPAIEKISKTKYDDGDYMYPRTFGMTDGKSNEFMFRFNRYSLHKANTLIEAAYLAVIEFIKYQKE